MQNLLSILNKILLLNFSCFIIFAPYDHKYIGKACFVIGIALWIIINLMKYRLNFYKYLLVANPLEKNLALFIIAAVLSTILSININDSLGILFERYVAYIICFYLGLGVAINSKDNQRVVSITILAASTFFAVGGIWDYFHLIAPNAYQDRLWSVFGRQIPFYGFPLYLTYFMPFNFLTALEEKNKYLKIFAWVNVLLLSLCLIWNASRAAWVAIFISLLFISFSRMQRKGLLIVLIMLVLLFVNCFFPKIKERVKTIPYPAQWSYRLPLYQSAIKIFSDYPIFGAGIGTYGKLIQAPHYALPTDYPVAKELNLHTHNTYLEIMAEMGIFGFISFILIFIFFYKHAFLMKKSGSILNPANQAIFIALDTTILAILLFALSTTIITVGVNNSMYFWLLLGIATSFMTIKKRD